MGLSLVLQAPQIAELSSNTKRIIGNPLLDHCFHKFTQRSLFEKSFTKTFKQIKIQSYDIVISKPNQTKPKSKTLIY